jgi:hypothetical protein
MKPPGGELLPLDKLFQEWNNRLLTLEATTLDEMARLLEEAAAELRRMQGAGVQLAVGVADDYARLVTDDLAVAREFGFESVVGTEDDADDPGEPARPTLGRMDKPGREKSAGTRRQPG